MLFLSVEKSTVRKISGSAGVGFTYVSLKKMFEVCHFFFTMENHNKFLVALYVPQLYPDLNYYSTAF